MKIGLLGVSFLSGNLGCQALSYSCLEILNIIAKEKQTTFDVFVMLSFPTKKWLKSRMNKEVYKKPSLPKGQYSNLNVDILFYRQKENKILFFGNVKKLNYVIDLTAGDSFTDIYGKERFFEGTSMKNYVISKNIPLILGSQTIGPFRDKNIQSIASETISKCYAVYARDKKSYDYTMEISEVEPRLTTDVAFFLPYSNKTINKTKIRVGVNVSGLLWNGGYTKDNQFGLKFDYQKYCRMILSELSKNDDYEVHLIIHVYSANMSVLDNDLIPMEILKKEFPNVFVSPVFQTPMEAKSYISTMDIFTGARMHSTIAAFSAAVPVIPFSYSRKFEGLFGSLDYTYLVKGCSFSLDYAVECTLAWIEKRYELKNNMTNGMRIIKEQGEFLIQDLGKILL